MTLEERLDHIIKKQGVAKTEFSRRIGVNFFIYRKRTDLLMIAKDDGLSRKLQDLELPVRKRALILTELSR